MQLKKHNRNLDFINNEVVVRYQGNYYGSIRGNVYSKLKGAEPLKPIYGTPYGQVYVQGELEYVHRIIASLFINNPYNYNDVHHKNGVKTDNRAENLEWIHKRNHQTIHKGNKCRCNGLPIIFDSQSQGAMFFGLHASQVNQAINGKSKSAGKLLGKKLNWYEINNEEDK